MIYLDDAKQAILDLPNAYNGFSDTYDKACIIGVLEEIPSAQPERKWIPCSERLPEHRLYVLVTYKYEYGLIDNGITWYSETENKWNTSREVIAWMPLPEPYKGDES